MQNRLKSLLLLRHAKSSWSNARLKDFDRPLNARGLMAAPIIAQHLVENCPLPDLILCSTSQRTRETLAFVMQNYRHPVKIIMTRDLYMASSLDIISLIKHHGSTEETIMVIGHNPGMEDTSISLAVDGDETAYRNLREKFPTAACAILKLDISDWSKLKADQGHLEAFIRPRDLTDEV